MKICPRCKRTEQETEFYTKGKNKYCRECWRSIVREWKKTDKGKVSVERTREYKRYKHRQTEQYKVNQKKREDRKIKKAKEEKERLSKWRLKTKEQEAERERRINSPQLVCATCGETRDNEDFYRYKNGLPRKTCKVCQLKSFAEMKTKKKSFAKVRARKLVNAAVENGDIIKPDMCEKCKLPSYVEAHHHDYSMPTDVTWLCVYCHDNVHRTR